MSLKNSALSEGVRDSELTSYRMPPEMKLGAPMLRVRNLERELAFYESDLGLRVNRHNPDPEDGLELVELGFKGKFRDYREALLVLKHDPNARETGHDFAGLYHFAILVSDRESLASTYLAVGNTGALYDGFADHSVSESLYLHDVERNGIEIYADRPRNTWVNFMQLMKAGDIRNAISLNKPLDFNSLLSDLTKDEMENPTSFPRGARIGHVHLRVTDLERSVRFYHETLGLDIIGNVPGFGAAFLSVGGYHHHVGLNTWRSLAGSPHMEGEAGLENFTMIVPDRNALRLLASRFPDSPEKNGRLAITDPDGIRILIESRH